MRPLLHFSPSRGWMNDPNGLIEWMGRHHLFFQYNPASTEFTNQHWGHASSTDLLTWTEHEVALSPGDPNREPYDSTAVFSGCAVDDGGRVALLYTGVQGERSLPCLAHATDDTLTSFRKDPKNPVIDAWPSDDVTDFRDHSVWRDGDQWRQIVGGAGVGLGGSAFCYTSPDLRQWTYDGVLADATHAAIPEGTWECPDLFRVDGVDVLVVSLILPPHIGGHEVWWMTGRLDGGRFVGEDCGPIDLGTRFYAPQSYTAHDGRRIMIGWIRTHDDPASEGAASLGAMSLPRQLDVVDGRVVVVPVDEVRARRELSICLPLDHDDVTVAVLDRDLEVTGELVLDSAAGERGRSMTLVDDVGHELSLDLGSFTGSGELSMVWDAGIVEIFRDGRAGVWSDLALGPVREVRVGHASGATGDMTVWRLTGETEEKQR